MQPATEAIVEVQEEVPDVQAGPTRERAHAARPGQWRQGQSEGADIKTAPGHRPQGSTHSVGRVMDLSHEAQESFRKAVNECHVDNDAAASEIEDYVGGLLAVIERHGGRRCDIAACNCNSYHWPRCESLAAERNAEMREMEREAREAYAEGRQDGYEEGRDEAYR